MSEKHLNSGKFTRPGSPTWQRASTTRRKSPPPFDSRVPASSGAYADRNTWRRPPVKSADSRAYKTQKMPSHVSGESADFTQIVPLDFSIPPLPPPTVQLYTTPLENVNLGDGHRVLFNPPSNRVIPIIYDYIEYYQFVPYSPTSIYTKNTHMQTILSQLGPFARTNTYPWIIPIGSTFAKYQLAHKTLIHTLAFIFPDTFMNLYVCGIAYQSNGTISDIQLTVTGTVDKGFTPAETAKKELAEELGLYVKLTDLRQIYTTDMAEYLFVVHVSKCSIIPVEEDHDHPLTPGICVGGCMPRPSRPCRKVVVAVVGELDVLHNTLSLPRNRLIDRNILDLMNIDGIVLTKATDIAHMYDTIDPKSKTAKG